jgi:hypothetical protein
MKKSNGIKTYLREAEANGKRKFRIKRSVYQQAPSHKIINEQIYKRMYVYLQSSVS